MDSRTGYHPVGQRAPTADWPCSPRQQARRMQRGPHVRYRKREPLREKARARVLVSHLGSPPVRSSTQSFQSLRIFATSLRLKSEFETDFVVFDRPCQAESCLVQKLAYLLQVSMERIQCRSGKGVKGVPGSEDCRAACPTKSGKGREMSKWASIWAETRSAPPLCFRRAPTPVLLVISYAYYLLAP